MRRREPRPLLRRLRRLVLALSLTVVLPAGWLVARGLAQDRDFAAAWRAWRAPALDPAR